MSNSKDSLTQQPGLSPARRAILEKWKHGKAVEISGAQSISRRVGQGPVPVSFAQERLWFLDQLEPGNPFYNMDFAWRLHAALDPDALAWAVERIVDRHEVLRTRFVSEAGRPRQEVLERLHVPVDFDDLRELPPAQREARAVAL